MSHPLIGRVSAGEDLSQADMGEAVDQIMRGAWPEEQMAVFLTALHHKGETAEEVAGAAAAMRQHMTRLRSDHPVLLDTCGTGGDGSGTFNISTAAAIVTAAAGVPVAKHGNRGMTSKSGSADVLAVLGVNIEASVQQAEACLAEIGLCFCFAPLLHGAMRHVSSVRRQLGFRTIFNLLGPLSNPAGATHQLLGVGHASLRPLLATALHHLGAEHALVVCGRDGLDEVTLRGLTDCTEVTPQVTRELTWSAQDFGLPEASSYETIRIDGPEASAAMIRRVLDNEPGTARDLVVINAAAALWVAGQGMPADCARRAEETIASGAARELLQSLALRSHRA